MTNIEIFWRSHGSRSRAIDQHAREAPHSLGPLIPIALLTAFMLWAVINPMW
ncbi:MAG: hypothetical protein ACREB1_10335 [Sphingomicrobium sp.]